MIEQLAAAVCTVYGISYSTYYLTYLGRHLRCVFRGSKSESPEPAADSPLAPSAPGDKTKEEQNEHKPAAVVPAQPEYSKQVAIRKINLDELRKKKRKVNEFMKKNRNPRLFGYVDGLQGQRASSNVQWRERAEERRETEEPSGRVVNAATMHEGPVMDLSILLSIFQSMEDGHVIARHPDIPLEALPWREFCELLRENVEALILKLHEADKKICHLEYICKYKTDTMNKLQQNEEDAFAQMSEQLKAQEDCKEKEKQYLEQQYSNLFAQVLARAQECKEMAQKSNQKALGLEQIYKKLAHENNSVKNSLSHVHKERSSLLAACALLSGTLCPLYSRLCAVSSQRNILQGQANLHELVTQKIRSLLYALPRNMERNQEEERLRQRRAKQLIYVFRRAVIAVLATNRLRALARYSCSLFVWTDGSRGGTRIPVCVGESRGRHYVSSFEEEGVGNIEALDWLTSSNLFTAIISSFSELQDVLSKPDPNSWLSGHLLINAAQNSFAKLMDNLSMLMETVQEKPCRRRAYLKQDSLIQRLACGLHRVNAQALEAGLYDRLPSTRNIAILQQEISEFSKRLQMAEVESRSLHLQLEEFKCTFNEMQKDAEKAHRLQEQLNELQHNLSNAREELRRRDQALNHHKKLLKDMEQDRQWLREELQEAEHALQQAAKDNKLIINHMKTVDATLNAVKDQAVAPGAAATLLPSLQLEILPEEAMRGGPEAGAFQDVLTSFMDLYSLAAARVEALTIGRESLRVHFEPEAAVKPPAPAPAESLWLPFAPQGTSKPPTPAESLRLRFVPRGASAAHGPAPDCLWKFS